jgi:NADH-ubiquinone oxidoreductase chain 2
MAGIPPFLGFFAKQFVLLSAIESGYWFITVVAILTSIISAAYYLRIVAILVTHTPTTSKTKVINNNSLAPPSTDAGGTRHSDNSEIISDLHCFLISTLTLLIILFMFKPTLLLNSTQLLALSLFYT